MDFKVRLLRYKKKTPYNRLIIRSLGGCPVGFEPTTFRTTI